MKTTMRLGGRIRILCVVAGLALMPLLAQAATNRWTLNSGTADWFASTANWSLNQFPVAGDDVVITNVGVTVTLSAAAPASGWLASLTISNTATLTFTNWSTTLSATNITIQKSATVTCAGPFPNAVMSNRVYLVCSNLLVATSGSINVNAKGYSAGAGPGTGGGAGYGGQGQTSDGKPGGAPYGSERDPSDPGSGGGAGGHGGGAVRVEAQGAVVVNGTISANGVDNVGSPGSGGSVYIACTTFAGTNGTVSANGEGPLFSSGNGGGGGGRIAIRYTAAAQAGLPVPGVTFSAAGGARAGTLTGAPQNAYRGDLGTLYLTDAKWLTETIPHSGQLVIDGLTNWSGAQLTVTNGWIRFTGENFKFTVTNNLKIDGWYGRLELGASQWTNRAAFNNYHNPTSGPTLTVGGNLILTNGGALFVNSGVTNGTARDYGALVSVAGTATLAYISWIVPISHPIDGGSVLFQLGHLAVSTNAGFDASGRGWAGGYLTNGYGLGSGLVTGPVTIAGGGYGGLGRTGDSKPSGAIYGSSIAPLSPGSGGGINNARAGNGGGLVRLEVAGTLTLNGALKADGMADGSLTDAGNGGGSGGGIYLRCRDIAGTTNGLLSAKGGWTPSSSGGSGGGGRIAVWYSRFDTTAGAVSNTVAGGKAGSSAASASGTFVWQKTPAPAGTVVIVR